MLFSLEKEADVFIKGMSFIFGRWKRNCRSKTEGFISVMGKAAKWKDIIFIRKKKAREKYKKRFFPARKGYARCMPPGKGSLP